jgi:hypothetical protein
MNLELLKTELDLATQAELDSDEQLRKLIAVIGKVGEPNSTTNASDCAKLVGSALALNERLRERSKSIRDAISKLSYRAEVAAKAQAK